MAYREVAMWEILAVLEWIERGETQAGVARTTGHGRKPIRGYVRTARSLGWEAGSEPPTEALAVAVFERHRPAGDRGPGAVEEDLLHHLETIRGWLEPAPGEKQGLQLTKVQELLERQGVRVAYTTLHRFAGKHCGSGRIGRTTVRMAECEPGELAEVDFGRLLRTIKTPRTSVTARPRSGARRTRKASAELPSSKRTEQTTNHPEPRPSGSPARARRRKRCPVR